MELLQTELAILSEPEDEQYSCSPTSAEPCYLSGWRLHLTTLGYVLLCFGLNGQSLLNSIHLQRCIISTSSQSRGHNCQYFTGGYYERLARI